MDKVILKKRIDATVIIPVYNTDKYIERAVKSVLNQTMGNFEILLVDDGSSDGSWEVCRKLSILEDRITAIRNQHSGVSAARNIGIEQAQGRYLFFLDSDDEWEDSLLENVLNTFEETGCDCVRFQFSATRVGFLPVVLTRQIKSIYSQKEWIILSMSENAFYCNVSSACFGAYKKEIIDKYKIFFSEELVQGEDGLFVIEYLLNSRNISYLEDRLYIYHVLFENGERINTTARNWKELYDEYELCFLIFEKVYEVYNDQFTDEEKKGVYSSFYDRIIGRLVRYGAYSKHIKMKDKIKALKCLINSSMMKDAGLYYKPFRKTDSRVIPFFMKQSYPTLLWLALKVKSWEYYKKYGKKKYAMSIYKKNKLTEYWVKKG